MESFIVPVYVKLGKLSDEKLLCGLFMVNIDQVHFQYSTKRIQLISQISGEATYELSKTILEQIKHKVQKTNVEITNANKTVIPVNHIFNIDYFDYLKKYGQNTIMVGEIQPISTEVDFKSLYEKTFHEKVEVQKVHKINFHNKIKSLFKTSIVEDKADIGLKIMPSQLPGLNFDTTVALIAKNGCVLAADTIDFTSSPNSIGNTLNAFDVLIMSLNIFSEKNSLKKGKYHLLIKEPLPGTEQEKIFNSIYNSHKNIYEIAQEEKVSEITFEIENKEYTKFSLAI